MRPPFPTLEHRREMERLRSIEAVQDCAAERRTDFARSRENLGAIDRARRHAGPWYIAAPHQHGTRRGQRRFRLPANG